MHSLMTALNIEATITAISRLARYFIPSVVCGPFERSASDAWCRATVLYADDFVIGFREESDARRCLAALKERFAKFGLELHPDKTRLIEFERHAGERRAKRGESLPETFDFLDFTHISGKTRRGEFTVHRKTSRKKFPTNLDALRVELQLRRHADPAETGGWLPSVYRGWCQYYAVRKGIGCHAFVCSSRVFHG